LIFSFSVIICRSSEILDLQKDWLTSGDGNLFKGCFVVFYKTLYAHFAFPAGMAKHFCAVFLGRSSRSIVEVKLSNRKLVIRVVKTMTSSFCYLKKKQSMIGKV